MTPQLPNDKNNGCFKSHVQWALLTLCACCGLTIVAAAWLYARDEQVDDRIQVVERVQAADDVRWEQIRRDVREIKDAVKR